jgi:hypothetical protein
MKNVNASLAGKSVMVTSLLYSIQVMNKLTFEKKREGTGCDGSKNHKIVKFKQTSFLCGYSPKILQKYCNL